MTGAHRWLGSEWVKFAAECIDCYYAEVFDSAEGAIQRAHVLNPELDVARPCIPPPVRLAS
jgi:hypothetical protein